MGQVKIKCIKDTENFKVGEVALASKKSAESYVKNGYAEYINEPKEKKGRKSSKVEDLRVSEDFNEHANKHKELLRDPELFNKMFKTELDKKIVGEIESRKVIGLCAYGGRLVKNSQVASFNLMVNDDAGVGKDYITGASLEMVPNQFIQKRTRVSATVLNYWHNSQEEPQWTWDGKVLYLEDISETILNHEVFKVMCSSGSSASIVKDQKVIDLEVKGKPVMIITTATATPNPELTRRFVILNLDSSIDQTKEIMKRHSEFRKNGIVPVVEAKYRTAMQFLDRVSVMIPFADKIHDHFPTKNIIMRTHYPRFLDFISASAAFHQFQRKKKNGFVIAEGEDYDLARACFLKICSNKYMIPLTIIQKKILGLFEVEPTLQGTISELHASKMNFVSDRALSYNLSLLSKYGILKTEPKLNQQNKTVECYKLCGEYKPNEKIIIPTYQEVCRIASEPSEPSPPSTTSIPSLPNKKVKKEGFLEVAKVPKREMGFSSEEEKQILEDFS